jgi:hypothetical protein
MIITIEVGDRLGSLIGLAVTLPFLAVVLTLLVVAIDRWGRK